MIENTKGHDYFVYNELNQKVETKYLHDHPYLFFDSDTMYINISEPEVPLNTPSNNSIIKLGEHLPYQGYIFYEKCNDRKH